MYISLEIMHIMMTSCCIVLCRFRDCVRCCFPFLLLPFFRWQFLLISRHSLELSSFQRVAAASFHENVNACDTHIGGDAKEKKKEEERGGNTHCL